MPLGKLHNERLVPLDAETYTVLARLQAEAPEASPWLLTGARGRPRALSTYQAALNAIAGDLPMPAPLTTHRLRHPFATSLMEGA